MNGLPVTAAAGTLEITPLGMLAQMLLRLPMRNAKYGSEELGGRHVSELAEANRGDVDLIRTATSHTFDALVLKEPGPVVVEFMSYGCAHCRQLEPVLQQVAALVTTKEKLFRVNVAVENTLADSYQIGGTPTLIMFLNGQEVGRSEGPRPTLPGVLTAVTQPFESR